MIDSRSLQRMRAKLVGETFTFASDDDYLYLRCIGVPEQGVTLDALPGMGPWTAWGAQNLYVYSWSQMKAEVPPEQICPSDYRETAGAWLLSRYPQLKFWANERLISKANNRSQSAHEAYLQAIDEARSLALSIKAEIIFDGEKPV